MIFRLLYYFYIKILMITKFGMDYGLKPPLMLVPDISFFENYPKAECQGLVYVSCPDTTGREIPCEFGFMMKNEKYADLFLDSLISWQEKSKTSKAVDLEFFEKLNGEYMLTIGTDMRLFMERMIPEHLSDFVSPLSVSAYHSKGGMQISKNYENFRDNYLEGRKIAVRYFLTDENHTITKKSEKYFVKTEFKFSKEGDKNASPMNPLLYKEVEHEKMPMTDPASEEFLGYRVAKLKYFFPVTHQKVHKKDWLLDVIRTINKRYTSDQIFQGICNLVMYERFKNTDNREIKLSESGSGIPIIEYLVENHESFDSYFPDASYFTKQVLEKQIRRDEKYVKLNLNKKKKP